MKRVLLECDKPTSSNVVYTKQLITDTILNNPSVQERLKTNTLFIEKFIDYIRTREVDLSNAIGIIKRFYFEDNILYADIECLPGHTVGDIFISGDTPDVKYLTTDIICYNKRFTTTKSISFATSFIFYKILGREVQKKWERPKVL